MSKKLVKVIAARHGWKQRLHYDPMVDVVQQAIRRSGKTFVELSEVSGLSAQTIANIDNDKTRFPQGLTVYCILRACGKELKVGDE